MNIEREQLIRRGLVLIHAGHGLPMDYIVEATEAGISLDILYAAAEDAAEIVSEDAEFTEATLQQYEFEEFTI